MTTLLNEAHEHVDLKIYGRVQCVGFREFVKKKANEIGDINGWVENVADGTVHVLASGPAENIEKLLKICNQGPLFAKVEKMERQPVTEPPNIIGFVRK